MSQNGHYREFVIMPIRMVIRGLSQESTHIFYRSDRKYPEAFGALNDIGYLTFYITENIDFYAGNALVIPSGLITTVVKWTSNEAIFRIHNPTPLKISGNVSTPFAIKTLKQGTRNVSIDSRQSILVTF